MKEYYVYCHKNPETLEIFYIGKGTKKRAYKKDGLLNTGLFSFHS
jgi:hypothetical protein